jgi:hypothetical protein
MITAQPQSEEATATAECLSDEKGQPVEKHRRRSARPHRAPIVQDGMMRWTHPRLKTVTVVSIGSDWVKIQEGWFGLRDRLMKKPSLEKYAREFDNLIVQGNKNVIEYGELIIGLGRELLCIWKKVQKASTTCALSSRRRGRMRSYHTILKKFATRQNFLDLMDGESF